MLLRLLPLICMFAAAAAQRTYYCTSSAGVIRDSDFYLETRNRTEEFNTTNVCEFNAESISVAFLVDIEFISNIFGTSLVLTVDSMGSTLFSGSQLADYQKAFATPSRNLRVRFNGTEKDFRFGDARLRVRAFDTNGCPPDWGYLNGNCYGRNIVFKSTPSAGNLNYTDAQKACNNMRSNLLHLPSNYTGSLMSFRNLLPGYLRNQYTWIGLTDRSSQYTYTWLNGVRQISTDEISCYYAGGSSTSCLPFERCGTFSDTRGTYAIEMDNCNKTKNYACFMPPGGTGNFYSVPRQNDSGTVYPRTNTYVDSGVIWGSIVGGIVIISIIVGAVYGGIRYSQMRRAAGTGATVPQQYGAV